MVRRLPESGWFIVCLIACVFAAILIWLGFWRYEIYRAGVDDGIFTQVVNSIGGCFCSTPEGINHLLVHWSPMLLLGYPFVKAFYGARGLIVLQSIAVCVTVFPLYGIARKYLDEVPAAVISGVAMLYPPLWAETFGDFHENAFVPALSATLAWAIKSRRWRWGLLSAAALLCVKEDQFVLLALAGAIIVLTSWRDVPLRRFGAAVAALALVSGVAYFWVIRPAFHSGIPYWSLHFYEWDPHITSPRGFVSPTSPERLYYLFWAFLPLLFLPFRSRLVLLALPGFLEVLLSRERITMILGTHYSMVWSGYVLAAFVDATSLLALRGALYKTVPSVAVAIVSLAVFRYHDPMARWYYLYRLPDANDALMQRTLASISPSSSISATDEIFAHLGDRPNAGIRVTGEYFVSDSFHDNPTWINRDKPVLDAQVRAGAYRIVMRRDGIIVARRVR